MTKQYDLIAIGTGTGASGAASRCRGAGWKVAVIDHLPFGGTCALRGCDPKKVLVGVAEAIDHSRRMRGKGIGAGEPSIVWNELIKFKRTFTEPVPVMKLAWRAAPRSQPRQIVRQVLDILVAQRARHAGHVACVAR